MDTRCQEHNHPEKTLKGGGEGEWDRLGDSEKDRSVPGVPGDYSELAATLGLLSPG